VVATGGGAGDEAAFTVRAFAPSQEEALWTFTHSDLQVLQVALALAIGNYGEVYAGGLGANGYPPSRSSGADDAASFARKPVAIRAG
jgi:hypothetical protein